ncbi:MAG: SDR family oxidoreductase, partial [Pseudomonadota bacterium]|nr:SDR family oxidoreductase [Pseudomonadota bacterium]
TPLNACAGFSSSSSGFLYRHYAHLRTQRFHLTDCPDFRGHLSSIETLTPAHFDKTFNLNARAPVFLVQKLLPLMTRGGSIVLVSSAMHLKGFPGHTAYAATKAALRSYARTWAAEFKDRGIRVNTLSPGVIDTPILDSQAPTPEAREALVNMYLGMIPLGRLGRAEEMANAALFLASDQSSYMTGSDLMGDGGAGQV